MNDVSELINEIDTYENVDIISTIKVFEKKLKKCFKLYENMVGFEDFKMNNMDYVILYTIWKLLQRKGNIETYLIIIYSYYKLENFHFPTKKFNCKNIYSTIYETNIIKILNNFICI